MAPLDVVLWTLAAAWSAAAAAVALAQRAIGRLPARDAAADARVTIVVAARDEQARIGTTVERLLRQTGIDAEVVVVDDRSTDRTSEILAELARTWPRLKLARVDRLPPGWIGKTHACDVGARLATGAWLLFADGDAWMERDLVARAVSAATRAGADHLCLIPGESRTTLAGRAGLLVCYLGLAPVAALANRDLWRGSLGIGAFTLVRTAAYRAVGGHAALRFEIVEDAALGRRLLRAGYRSRLLDAHRDLQVAWGGTLGGTVRALEKNLFAATGYRTLAAVLLVVALLAVWLASALAPLGGSPAGLAAGAGLLATALPAWILARRLELGGLAACLVPLILPAIPLALARSTWTTLRRGGVEWRGTFYPLAELRRAAAGSAGAGPQSD